jgi:hypothetical protein
MDGFVTAGIVPAIQVFFQIDVLKFVDARYKGWA